MVVNYEYIRARRILWAISRDRLNRMAKPGLTNFNPQKVI